MHYELCSMQYAVCTMHYALMHYAAQALCRAAPLNGNSSAHTLLYVLGPIMSSIVANAARGKEEKNFHFSRLNIPGWAIPSTGRYIVGVDVSQC